MGFQFDDGFEFLSCCLLCKHFLGMEEMEEEPQEETFKEEVSENNQPLQQQPLRKKRKLALPKRGNKLTDADLPFGVMEGEQRKRKRAKREDNEKQVGEEENWGGEWAEGEEKLQKLRDTWYSSLVFPRIASSFVSSSAPILHFFSYFSHFFF